MSSLQRIAIVGALVLSLADHGAGLAVLAMVQLGLLIALTIGLFQAGHTRRVWSGSLAGCLALWWIWLQFTRIWSADGPASTHGAWSLGVLALAALALVAASASPAPSKAARPAGRRPIFGDYFWPLLSVFAALTLWSLAEQLTGQGDGAAAFLHRHNLAAFLNLLLIPFVACLTGQLYVASSASANRTAVQAHMATSTSDAAAGTDGHVRKRMIALLSLLVLAAVAAVAGTHGRGALLALLAGLGFAGTALIAMLDRRCVVLVVALLVGGGLAAETLLGGTVSHSAARLLDETRVAVHAATEIGSEGGGESAVQDSQRLLLWHQSLQLLADSPWHGVGAGAFWVAFSPYRGAADTTGGYHAHNDYLQMLIELGWPGTALFVCALLAALLSAWRLARNPALAPMHRAEAAGLGGGLLSVSVHAMVSFPFYVTAIGLLAGLLAGRLLILGRLARLQTSGTPASTGRAGWAGRLSSASWCRVKPLFDGPRALASDTARGQRVVRCLAAAFVAWALTQHLATIWGDQLFKAGNQHLASASFDDAERSYMRAYRIADDDRALVGLLNLYGHVHDRLEPLSTAAGTISARAERVSVELVRLRPQSALAAAAAGEFFIRAASSAGDNLAEQAENHLRRALHLDPRLFAARRQLTELKRAQGDSAEALRLANEGLLWPIPESPATLPFLGLAVQLQIESGQLDKARDTYQQILATMARFDMAASTLEAIGVPRWQPRLNG